MRWFLLLVMWALWGGFWDQYVQHYGHNNDVYICGWVISLTATLTTLLYTLIRPTPKVDHLFERLYDLYNRLNEAVRELDNNAWNLKTEVKVIRSYREEIQKDFDKFKNLKSSLDKIYQANRNSAVVGEGDRIVEVVIREEDETNEEFFERLLSKLH